MAKRNRTPTSPDEIKNLADKKRRALIFLGVAVGILVVVSLIPSSDDSSSDGNNADNGNETSQPVDATPSGQLTDLVGKATGKSNLNGYGDRIQLAEWTEEQTLIRLLGDQNLTSGLMKSANRRLVLDAIKAYQSAGLTSEFIAVDIYYPLVDNLGTEKLYRVLGYGFTQERIMAINTDNIDTKRMDENFADEFTYVHPEFRW
jgi:hypothetical protein